MMIMIYFSGIFNVYFLYLARLFPNKQASANRFVDGKVG